MKIKGTRSRTLYPDDYFENIQELFYMNHHRQTQQQFSEKDKDDEDIELDEFLDTLLSFLDEYED